jgi:hypothetical protein
MLQDIGAEWVELLPQDDDNATSPTRDNLHPKAMANAGEVGALLSRLTEPPLPEFFETCPACEGDGCGWCYGRGLAHPENADHYFYQIASTIGFPRDLTRTLERPDFPHRHARELEWGYVMGLAAGCLLARWLQEDTADHTEYWPFDPRRPYQIE